jgi:uncharacterized protein (TIGR01244 family)
MKLIIIGAIILVALILVGNKVFGKQDGLNMQNQAHPTENLMTGGQPSLGDLAELKARGITTVINLRGLSENSGYDEAEELKKLGMTYIQIPMDSAADLTNENVVKLDEALKNINGTALVHCASGNRVGALLALREFQINGKTAEEAMAFGKSAGMTKLAPAVESLLVK